jgi:Protein of unknown function (DUF1453)
MTPQLHHILVTLALLAFIGWRMHARMRRLIGRQRFSRRRPIFQLILFPALLVLLMKAPHPQALEGSYLLIGVGLGLVLGVLGLRLTRYERTPEGLFYTPNAHLGIALTVLLLVRIGYRFATGAFDNSMQGTPGAGLTPLTMLLFGALAGYYCTYAAGLLWWSLRTPPSAAALIPGAPPEAASESLQQPK